MEIRHFKLIKAIVEQGGITKAVGKLHLTQSALSHQLKEIENELGTDVFRRQKKKLILTPAGAKLYETANRIIKIIADMEQEIKVLPAGASGEIRISTECYSSYHWLPAVLRKFHSLHPNIELKIVMEATHNPLKKLLLDELDIAIVSDRLESEKIRYVELFQDEMVMVVSENHPWARKKFVTAEDFADQHLLIHSLPLETVTVYRSLLAPAKVSAKRITPLPLTEASIEMVKADMGVMAMANWALKPYLKSNPIRGVKIGRIGLKRVHYLALLTSKSYPPYFDQFINFLQKEIHSQWNI